MVLQEELVIFDLGNSCSNSSRKWYQYAHAAVEIIERKSFLKVTKQFSGVEGTGSKAQGCLTHSVLWTTVKAQCWRTATRQREHEAGIRAHTRNSSKSRQLYVGQMGGGNGSQISATVGAQLGCDAEKQKDWKEVWYSGDLWLAGSCVRMPMCVSSLMFPCTVCVRTDTSTLLWKPSCSQGLFPSRACPAWSGCVCGSGSSNILFSLSAFSSALFTLSFSFLLWLGIK